MHADLMGRKKEEGSRCLYKTMSELRRIDDALPRSACSSSPFLFSLSYIFFRFFPFYCSPSSLPSFDPLIKWLA